MHSSIWEFDSLSSLAWAMDTRLKGYAWYDNCSLMTLSVIKAHLICTILRKEDKESLEQNSCFSN